MNINENMTRKHNWDQLQAIQKKIDKQGGDISSKLKGEYKKQGKINNSKGLENPMKKKIALSDDEKNANTHTDPQLKNLPKNSLIFKESIISFEDYISEKNESKIMEKEDRGNVNDIHRNMKTIRNWNNYFTSNVVGNPKAEQPRNILSGRQVYNGEKEGYIEDVQGDKVIIQTTDNSGNIVKKFSDVVKTYKIEKGENVNNDSELKGPKQIDKNTISDNGEIKKISDKSEETKDSKKIGSEIYKTKDVKIKKLQEFGKTKF